MDWQPRQLEPRVAQLLDLQYSFWTASSRLRNVIGFKTAISCFVFIDLTNFSICYLNLLRRVFTCLSIVNVQSSRLPRSRFSTQTPLDHIWFVFSRRWTRFLNIFVSHLNWFELIYRCSKIEFILFRFIATATKVYFVNKSFRGTKFSKNTKTVKADTSSTRQ